MEMPGSRRVTRRFVGELHTKGFMQPASVYGTREWAQPALESTPGSLAEQAAQMEQFGSFGRKSTEELFIQSFVESSSKGTLPSPMPESMSLLQDDDPQKYGRNTSEELFSSWISTSIQNQNTEPNTGAPSPGLHQCTRQEARRGSGELAALMQQNNIHNMALNGFDPYQRVDSLDNAFMSAKSFLADTDKFFESPTKSRTRNVVNKQSRSGSAPAPDLFDSPTAQKLWFESSMTMTRSRSSELKRKAAELESSMPPPMVGNKNLINLISRPISFTDPNGEAGHGWPTTQPLTLSDVPTQISDPSSSQAPPVNTSLSDVVGMLKGSLNKAKQRLVMQSGNAVGNAYPPVATSAAGAMRPFQDDVKGKKAQYLNMNGNCCTSPPPGLIDSSSVKVRHGDTEMKWGKMVDNPGHINLEKVDVQLKDDSYAQQIIPPKQISDSSAGAPVVGLSTGNEMICTNMMERHKGLKRGNADMDQLLAEPISIADLDAVELQSTLKNQENPSKQSDVLSRMGSIKSGGSCVEVIDDATKRRRVDRQRKMAEAKVRGVAPVSMPADLQAAVKKRETLEKEVRSLQLKLSFMNRKDSEQTKKIEELEEENKELKHKLELMHS